MGDDANPWSARPQSSQRARRRPRRIAQDVRPALSLECGSEGDGRPPDQADLDGGIHGRRYTVVRLLGRRDGVVYEAVDHQMGARVALTPIAYAANDGTTFGNETSWMPPFRMRCGMSHRF